MIIIVNTFKIERKDVNCILQDTNDFILDLLSKNYNLIKSKTQFINNTWVSEVMYSDIAETTINDFSIGDKVKVFNLKDDLNCMELGNGYVGTITNIGTSKEMSIELDNTWNVYPDEITLLKDEE